MPRQYTTRRPRVLVTCAPCGTAFWRIAGRPTKKFCSRACQGAASRIERPTLICPTCEQPFLPRVDRVEGRRWCSQRCYDAGRATARSRVCAGCGLAFEAQPARGERFCSLACYHARPRNDLSDRFWERVDTTGPCWLWTRALTGSGYGKLVHDGVQWPAHRLAWELAAGAPVPTGLNVGHTCDVRACVRADDEGTYEINGVMVPRRGHLFLCTHRQNMEDMAVKGRQAALPRHQRQAYTFLLAWWMSGRPPA